MQSVGGRDLAPGVRIGTKRHPRKDTRTKDQDQPHSLHPLLGFALPLHGWCVAIGQRHRYKVVLSGNLVVLLRDERDASVRA